MWWLLKQIKLIRQVWRYRGDPHAWALGVALGVLLGLVPKGNLTAVLISLLFFSLRVDLAIGLLTALAVSLLAGWLDPVTHAIGNILLGAPPLQSFWERVHRLPLVPWMRWNNTVVLGSLVLGAATTWPVYQRALRLAMGWSQTAESAARPLALPAPKGVACPETLEGQVAASQEHPRAPSPDGEPFHGTILLPLPDVSSVSPSSPDRKLIPARRAG